MDQDLDNKFRLVTAMHCNGPLPQVALFWWNRGSPECQYWQDPPPNFILLESTGIWSFLQILAGICGGG